MAWRARTQARRSVPLPVGAATFGQFYDEWQDKHGHADRAAPEVVTSGAREVGEQAAAWDAPHRHYSAATTPRARQQLLSSCDGAVWVLSIGLLSANTLLTAHPFLPAEAPKHEFGHGLFNKQAPAVATSGARDTHEFGHGLFNKQAPAVATSGARDTHEFGHGLFNKQAPAVATSGARDNKHNFGHGLFNKQAPAVATSGAREHTFGLGGGLLGLRAPGAIVTPTATPANCKSVADLIQSPEFSTLKAAVEVSPARCKLPQPATLTPFLAQPNPTQPRPAHAMPCCTAGGPMPTCSPRPSLACRPPA
jgi:hypothetical protein